MSGRVGYEVLEGDGTAALQTPLATLHAFNGFTDRFLATPAAGLTELYVKLAAKGTKDSALAGFKLALAYHEFQADANGADYGNEWSVALARAIATAHGTVIFSVKYADYTAKGFATDTTKLWLTAHYRY